jgi:hypothetical protein
VNLATHCLLVVMLKMRLSMSIFIFISMSVLYLYLLSIYAFMASIGTNVSKQIMFC